MKTHLLLSAALLLFSRQSQNPSPDFYDLSISGRAPPGPLGNKLAECAKNHFLARRGADDVVQAFQALYCYGYLEISASNGQRMYAPDNLVKKGLGVLCAQTTEDVLGAGVATHSDLLATDFVVTSASRLQRKALVVALKMCNAKSECMAILPGILRDARFREKSTLVVAATVLGIDWLSSEILMSGAISDSEMNFYFLLKKHFLDSENDALRQRISGVLETQGYAEVHRYVRRAVLDANETGHLHEIVAMQNSFNVIDASSFGLFINKKMIFAFEYAEDAKLRALVAGACEGYAWTDADVDFLIRECCCRTLQLVPGKLLRRRVAFLLQHEPGNARIVPALAIAMKRARGSEEATAKLRGAAGASFLRLYDLAMALSASPVARAATLQRFFRENENFVHEAPAAAWFARLPRRWSLLAAMAAQRVDVDEPTTFLLFQFNDGANFSAHKRLGNLRLRTSASFLALRPAMLGEAAACALEIEVTRFSAALVGAAARNGEFAHLKRLRDAIPGAEDALDAFVLAIADARSGYAKFATTYASSAVLVRFLATGVRVADLSGADASAAGNVSALHFLLNSGVRASTRWANAACAYGQIAALDVILAAGVRPDKHGMADATKNGHLSVLRRFSFLVTDSFYAYLACSAGHVDIVRFLHSIGVHADTHSANAACLNGHTDVLKFLMTKRIAPNAYGAFAAATKGHQDIVDHVIACGIITEAQLRDL